MKIHLIYEIRFFMHYLAAKMNNKWFAATIITFLKWLILWQSRFFLLHRKRCCENFLILAKQHINVAYPHLVYVCVFAIVNSAHFHFYKRWAMPEHNCFAKFAVKFICLEWKLIDVLRRKFSHSCKHATAHCTMYIAWARERTDECNGQKPLHVIIAFIGANA